MRKLLNSLLWRLGGSVPRNHRELLRLLDGVPGHTQQISDGEIRMLRNALSLAEQRVEDVMLPSGKVDWMHTDDTFAEIIEQAGKTRHSRYPVIEKDDQGVPGVLHIKRLIGLDAEPGERILKQRQGLLQPARIVPESKRLDAMLREFQYYRTHMMVVADEGGHPSGVVTIEDVLERIVGEIRDEFDANEGIVSSIRQQARPNSWLVGGETELEEFNEHFGLNLDEERFDTVGGWAANKLGRLPKQGERFAEADLALRISIADQRRVLEIEVERVPGKGAAAKQAGAG